MKLERLPLFVTRSSTATVLSGNMTLMRLLMVVFVISTLEAYTPLVCMSRLSAAARFDIEELHGNSSPCGKGRRPRCGRTRLCPIPTLDEFSVLGSSILG